MTNNDLFIKDKKYTEDDIYKLLQEQDKNITPTRFKWALFELQKSGLLSKIDKKTYIVNANKYDYKSSDLAIILCSFIEEKYPLINFTIFETEQLNEWANLLIANNNIIINVEKGYEETIFFALQESFSQELILLNPDEITLSRYMKNNLIIVRSLYSRSPLNKTNHKITLEKLIIDCFADKSLSTLLSFEDKTNMIEEIEKHYMINYSKLQTYAKRRNILNIIKNYITIQNNEEFGEKYNVG